MSSIKDIKYQELFRESFWKVSDINLFHFEDSLILIGNDQKQFQLKFIKFEDTFLPTIIDETSTDSQKINVDLVGLKLCYFKNRIKLKSIIKKYLPRRNISLDSRKNTSILSDLHLSNETKVYKYFLNKEKIFSNTTTNLIYQKNQHINKLIDNLNPKKIIFQELTEFNTDLDHLDYVEIKDDNIFSIFLNLFKTKKDKCVIKLDFDSRFYPMVPPKIQWISPVISKDDYSAILNSKIFSSEWSPLITLPWLFSQLKISLIEREKKNGTKYFSEKNTKFNYEDIIIMNFAKSIGRFTCSEPIKINSSTIKSSKNSKSHWKKGTGYGHRGLEDWSLSDYLNKQSNINSQITSNLLELEKLKSISSENKNYLLNICLREVIGITLLEINKYPELYLQYFKVIFKIADKDNFNSIESIKDVKVNFSNLIDNINISGMEDSYQEITSIISKLLQIIKIDEISESQHKDYCSIMKPLQFGYNDTSKCKFTFQDKSGKTTSTKQMMRIAQELSSLQKSLPLNEESSVWIRWDKNQLNKMQFIISGPKDTPYQDGLFLFDCYFPSNYPQDPPSIKLHTTGGGSVRFNPNLYKNGKVCLSLLGTWSGTGGEKWNAKTSTMLQVLVSIQSLILIEQPYFNEPGYEREIGTLRGNANNEEYNQNIRQATATWAIKDMIENPPKGFEEIIEHHFNLKKDNIKVMLKNWESKANKNKYKTNIQKTLDIF